MLDSEKNRMVRRYALVMLPLGQSIQKGDPRLARLPHRTTHEAEIIKVIAAAAQHLAMAKARPGDEVGLDSGVAVPATVTNVQTLGIVNEDATIFQSSHLPAASNFTASRGGRRWTFLNEPSGSALLWLCLPQALEFTADAFFSLASERP